MRCWVSTVSRAHVLEGIAGGFTQSDHGDSRLKRLSKGDGIIFYSPRAELRAGEAVQSFTAIGEIADDGPYQVEISPEFRPWRRRVSFRPSGEAPIRPLIAELEFIRDKKQWGFPFRRGFFEIGPADFERIERAMSYSTR